MTVLILAFCAIALLLAALGVLAIRLFGRLNDNEVNDAVWLESFSPLNYRPMERLLRDSDYHFLRAQAGYRPEIGRKLHSERRQILRMYLRRLTGDFSRLIRIANYVLLYSPVDRPDLAAEISSVRIRFYWAVLRAELILVSDLLPLGWMPSSDLFAPVDGILAALQPQQS